jgi:hypothetical protein
MANTIDETPKRSAAFLAIASSPNSTIAAVTLLREFAGAFRDGTLEHAARRLAGEAERPGTDGIDDRDALRRIAELEGEGLGRQAVGIVARTLAPGQPDRWPSIARRLSGKRTKTNRS